MSTTDKLKHVETIPVYVRESERILYELGNRVCIKSINDGTLGIDARHQQFPHESRYVYRPRAGQKDTNRWNKDARENVLACLTQMSLSL